MSTSYKLPELRMQISGRQDWTVTVPFGTDMKSVFQSGFWAHNARKLNPGDEITVVPDGLAWYAKLYVLDRGDNWAKVVPLYQADLNAADKPVGDAIASQFEVSWKGPAWGFVVARVDAPTEEPVAKGFRTRAEANRWVLENGRSLAA